MSSRKLFYDVNNIRIGCFWEIIDDQDGAHVEHLDGIYGSQNWLMIYSEHQFGISIITNLSFPDAN